MLPSGPRRSPDIIKARHKSWPCLGPILCASTVSYVSEANKAFTSSVFGAKSL